MSFLLISVVNRLGCESANVDNILTYKKIFVLELRTLKEVGQQYPGGFRVREVEGGGSARGGQELGCVGAGAPCGVQCRGR